MEDMADRTMLPNLEDQLLHTVLGGSRGEYAASDGQQVEIDRIIREVESNAGRAGVARMLDGWVTNPPLDRSELNPLGSRNPYPLVIASITQRFPWSELKPVIERLQGGSLTSLERTQMDRALQAIAKANP